MTTRTNLDLLTRLGEIMRDGTRGIDDSERLAIRAELERRLATGTSR